MAKEFGKVTRISVIMAAVIVVLMLATPVLQIGGKSVSPVDNAAAAPGIRNRVFNVGVVDLNGGVSTLNPFMYTMSAEYDLFGPVYSTLITYDVNTQTVGDLATSWSVAPDGVTWHFTLARNAYFCDPAAPADTSHPVTADDVIWTYWEINNDTKNHLSSYFNTGGVGIIDRMWKGVDQFDLYVKTTGPYAPFMGALHGIPIMPKYIWGAMSSHEILATKNLPPVGSGAFYCTVTALPLTGVAILKRNPIWYQEANKGWQIHVDTLQFKSESTTANAWTDLQGSNPGIDVYMNVAPAQYVANLINTTTPGIIGWAQSTGFVYEYQLNQLSLEKRAALHLPPGSNNQLLLDPTVKLAMAMCVDKPEFVKQVVMGLGSVADSLVPDCNPWHYTYPNPVQYNPSAARAMLMAAGWAFDEAGNPAGALQAPLYKAGGTDPLSFRMLTLLPNQEWQLGSGLLKEWAALGGVELTIELMNSNQANSAWFSGDYDTWLWDWVFMPTSDPSTDCLQVDTSMAIGTWSGSYWTNASFDALYNRSLVAMDPVARRELTDQMQASIYEDHNDILIAYTKYLYAASTARWNGPSYGDWAAHWTLMPDQGYPWLFMQLSPVDNLAPTVTVGQTTFTGSIGGTGIPVYGSATDGSSLLYQWYWGDGTKTGWVSSASQTHIYANDGVYEAYLAAQEQGPSLLPPPPTPPAIDDNFMRSAHTTIIAVDDTNRAPTVASIWQRPSSASGIEIWTVVRFVANATDLDGNPLYYNWNFGDTYTAVGRDVNHTFNAGGSYLVTVTVDDNHPGAGRPAVLTKSVSVRVNNPPSISIISSQTVLWKATAWFNATAYDTEDTLRFTWVWDDGSTTVTTSPKNVTHVYQQKGTDTLRVYADDLTGVAGHNVSATCNVKVTSTRSPPYALTLAVNRSSIWVGQSVAFTATAKDSAGDGMRFSVNCGDARYVSVDKPGTANDALVTATLAHTYLSAGIMTAHLYVTDGLDNTTLTTPVTVTVTLNHAPAFTSPPTNKKMWQGNLTSFSVAAFDQDGETLRYTWNFGDGTWLVGPTSTSRTYAKAGTYTYTVYVDDLTGLVGHNVSASATVKIAFNLPLLVGWNFVSVPVVGNGYKASNISLATGDMISSWSSATQKYDHTYIKGISPPVLDFAIAPNAGYWIWVAAAKTIHLYGSVPTATQTVTVTVPLSGGWVAFGLASMKTTFHAKDISTTMYSGTGAVTLGAFYNAATGKYSSWISALPAINNFALAPGVGYWIWVTAGPGGTLSYIP
jgi:peptide/nickel transport system substrate-binding protein